RSGAVAEAPPGKTPISLLQEYGTRIGRTPGYDLLKAEGQAHQPNFTFRVTVGHVSCTGVSLSLTAVAVAIRCPQRPVGDLALPVLGVTVTVPALPHTYPPPCTSTRVSPQALPTTYLYTYPHVSARIRTRVPQELVVQKGWRLPEYTVTQESGPAHRKEFTMTCRVERFVEIGSGTSKKLAKRNAAAKMLVRIHNVPMEPREGSEAEADDDQFSMAGPRVEGPRGRAPGCTWDSLRNSAGQRLAQLR
ncbi:TRBP2 protein, partial [Crypturellus undulatus]|nr:TRBP2 protein [Crypturellus undulatus]